MAVAHNLALDSYKKLKQGGLAVTESTHGIKELLDIAKSKGVNLSVSQFNTSLQIVQKMVKKMSESEFEQWISTGELPPLKLTKEEMESIRGGIIPLLIAGCAALAAGYQLGQVCNSIFR